MQPQKGVVPRIRFVASRRWSAGRKTADAGECDKWRAAAIRMDIAFFRGAGVTILTALHRSRGGIPMFCALRQHDASDRRALRGDEGRQAED
jgi:hypothetical protein